MSTQYTDFFFTRNMPAKNKLILTLSYLLCYDGDLLGLSFALRV